MESSILTSVKKMVGVTDNYTVFDLDILTSINAAFSTLSQIGVGSNVAFVVEDKAPKWDDFLTDPNVVSVVKMYIGLKVRMDFDPPQTSFLIGAMKEQIAEHVWRLQVMAERGPDE